jgi:hypothetical protein
VIGIAVMGSVHPLAAQQSQPSEAAPPAAEQPAPPRPPSGLIDVIGRWVEDSAQGVATQFKGARHSIDTAARTAGEMSLDAVGAAKGTADSITALPASRIVTGRAVCTVAANGAPDCKAAAESLCKSKNFRTGVSVDFQSAETCPPHVYLQGRQPNPGECKTETYITRAVCQ